MSISFERVLEAFTSLNNDRTINTPFIFFNEFNTPMILILRRVNHFMDNHASTFLNNAMDIRHTMNRFFRSPMEYGEFQDLQAYTGALVSGSIALQYFSREEYESDLDVFCELSKCVELAQWLQRIGYEYEASKKQKLGFNNDYRRVILEQSQLRVIHQPPDLPENEYRSDIHFNVDHWKQCYHSTPVRQLSNVLAMAQALRIALFPRTTLVEHRTVVFNQGKPFEQQLTSLKKWNDRDYPYSKTPNWQSVIDFRCEFYGGTTRFPRDSFCYSRELPYLGNRQPHQDRLECNSFQLTFSNHANNFFFERARVPPGSSAYIISKQELPRFNTQLNFYHNFIYNGTLSLTTVFTIDPDDVGIVFLLNWEYFDSD
ncbi:hypothetical protein BDP27DRAFT_1357189 [Rhodocollybia butyracea]|uniref:Uncharacterized protein n=1 Tax=Rhodocollybia butyracea TaxID=206335 RepID=A0A9P5UGS4_9AGAR|nr:hypothetical protein BDP27DRAFT_1357189 [Rhodocollybia butyracea]